MNKGFDRAEYQRKRYQSDPNFREKMKQQAHKWATGVGKAKKQAYNKAYIQAHREYYREYMRQWRKKKRENGK